jgi:hypothetical protein
LELNSKYANFALGGINMHLGGPWRFEVVSSIAVGIGHVLNEGMKDLTEDPIV